MKLTIQSFLAGIVLGAIFSLLNLPIPAPPNLAGIMGIVGIFVGFLILNRWNEMRGKAKRDLS
ncbi:XapX domain-containing protein [Ornithinibacillus salinisoli]|uniref:XapX domain-containing protein n=1 Tax=Ornithinibacillus salinisoli TaxID=1848459 RepID=A0ABW4VYI7_9BACI